jgi:PDDEXK-like domain of unknown function (DUF3799)
MAAKRKSARPYIAGPGAYDGVPIDIYHGACTPAPGISASGGWLIENECPAAYWRTSPYNPQRDQKEPKRYFDIGKAAHLLLLEESLLAREVAVIEAPDYKAKDAQRARDLYREAGKIPLLTHEHAQVEGMRDALRVHPIAQHAFKGGAIERSYFWRDEQFGIWCKCRPDYSATGFDYLVDYKTADNVKPAAIERAMASYGYFFSAAWYLDGVEAIEGVRPSRFALILQEKEPPYLISVVWIEPESLQWGRLLARHARWRFADCLARKEWPGYRPIGSADRDAAFTLGLPSWAKRALEHEFDRGAFDIPAPATEAAA